MSRLFPDRPPRLLPCLPHKSLGLKDFSTRDEDVKSRVLALQGAFPERFVLLPKAENNAWLEWYADVQESYGLPHALNISAPDRFPALANAFKYGAPPHAGVAPGVDRMVMLLTGSENIREVIAFPMNQKAQEPMMNSPHPVSEKQLRELHIKVRAQNVAPNAAAPAPAPAAPQA